MSIQVSLIHNPGFVHLPMRVLPALGATSGQTQTFSNFQLQNGYGQATTVSVSPGYGATVTASINIVVTSITEQSFTQIINEVKQSQTYKNNSSFQQFVNSASYSSAGSSSSGIFGWLFGGGSNSYSNQNSNLTNQINQYNSGDSSNDVTVANSVANIMLNQKSKVQITATVSVTGQLLVPSPTVIAVETTTFSFTDSQGNVSTVSLVDQAPLIPVNPNSGTVSPNTVAPGSKLNITPLGS